MVKNMGEMSMLYDFYGELLTNRQKDVLQYYYGDDYTLGEIAEMAGISRQAVYDTVSKAEKSLRSYEASLGLVRRFRRTEEEIHRASALIDEIIDSEHDSVLASKLTAVRNIINGLDEE
ncbi:MAG: YlxM family DNA-binding protein [Anaerovoracaceae bacterium]|jgi:predicted DNA-binding protein YlxM (UPF0122 family)